jgi:hypothetical protein
MKLICVTLFLLSSQAWASLVCSGVVKFTDPKSGETSYSDMGVQLTRNPDGSFATAVLLNSQQVASGTVKLGSPATFHADGVGASDAKVTWDGTLDFQVEGELVYGDVTFTRTTVAADGTVMENLAGHTYQECKKGRSLQPGP